MAPDKSSSSTEKVDYILSMRGAASTELMEWIVERGGSCTDRGMALLTEVMTEGCGWW